MWLPRLSKMNRNWNNEQEIISGYALNRKEDTNGISISNLYSYNLSSFFTAWA